MGDWKAGVLGTLLMDWRGTRTVGGPRMQRVVVEDKDAAHSGERGRPARRSLAPGTGTLSARNARARPAGSPGAFGGRTVARQRREPAEMGLVSRGAAAARPGAASVVVRPGPPDAIPNPIPTLPPKGVAPGSSR